eukprot:1145831-Pelagomonas_calceolata.AAC.4
MTGPISGQEKCDRSSFPPGCLKWIGLAAGTFHASGVHRLIIGRLACGVTTVSVPHSCSVIDWRNGA